MIVIDKESANLHSVVIRKEQIPWKDFKNKVPPLNDGFFCQRVGGNLMNLRYSKFKNVTIDLGTRLGVNIYFSEQEDWGSFSLSSLDEAE